MGRPAAGAAPHAAAAAAGGAASLWAFDDEACRELAARHGTPCFAYRAATARAGWQRLRAALAATPRLASRTRIAYAVKANPHPELLALLAGLGADFDCASGGELRAAHAARQAQRAASAARLLYAGPGKRDEELALAVELGARVQAEGWEDLVRLDALGAARGEVLTCNLRVHPAADIEEERAIIGGGGPSAFGVDEEQAPELLARAARLRHVRLTGLHVFAASNQRDAAKLLAIHALVLDLAHRLHAGHGLALEQIDLGGGLGVPYAADESPLDVERWASGLATLLDAQPWFDGELVLEPGRFLAAPCGVYLTRVVRTKTSRGQRFAVLEGGLNHLLRPLLTGQPFPVRRVEPRGAAPGAPPVATTLAGPLCTSLDRLGDVPLPDNLARGDLLAFGMAGAYGATEAMPHFLSHPAPPEVWID
jgi:diaminopimelate decarboxylase